MPRILTFTSGPEDWRERAATRLGRCSAKS